MVFIDGLILVGGLIKIANTWESRCQGFPHAGYIHKRRTLIYDLRCSLSGSNLHDIFVAKTCQLLFGKAFYVVITIDHLEPTHGFIYFKEVGRIYAPLALYSTFVAPVFKAQVFPLNFVPTSPAYCRG